MTAPLRAPLRARIAAEPAPIALTIDPPARAVRVARARARLDGDPLVLVTALAKVHPEPAFRDDLIPHVIGHRRLRDPARALRKIIARARARLRPLGVDVVHIPPPVFLGASGHYRFGVWPADGARGRS